MANLVHDTHEKVNDETSFIYFLQVLAEDRVDELKKEKEAPSSPYGPGANGWENGTIEDFLLSAVAWVQDTPTLEKSDNPWKRCADILLMGKFYE